MTEDLTTLRARRAGAAAALQDIEREYWRHVNRLAELDQQIRDLEQQQHVVRVRFDGTNQLYAYQLSPGRQAWVGDYVMVPSRQILKVRELGRGGYTGELQRAHRVNVEVLD